MNDNLAVIEVKPTVHLSELQKDIQTLVYLKSEGRYRAGVLLLFGPTRASWDEVRLAAEQEQVSLGDLIVLHHEDSGQAAKAINIG